MQYGTLFISVFFAFISAQVFAQGGGSSAPADTVELWKTSGNFNINGSQVSLTNWQAGGENSVAINGYFAYEAHYRKDNISWDNHVEAAIGTSRLSGGAFRKTDDRYELGSKFSYKVREDWDLTGFSTFKSQFTEGFKINDETGESRRISHALAPGYLFAGLGADWQPVEWFNINMAPLSTKMTFVRIQELADRGEYGVDPAEFDDQGNKVADGKNIRYEYGGYVKVRIQKEVFKNVSLKTKADFFSNYLENPGNIDITWDLMINMKINSWLSANLTTNLIYDDDIDVRVGTDDQGNPIAGPRTQFKQVFGAGLSLDL